MATKPMCSVDGCESAVRCSGLCGPHYKRFLKYDGDPTAGGPPRTRAAGVPCIVEGCERQKQCRIGYCLLHYQRHKRKGTITLSGPEKGSGRRFIAGLDEMREDCIQWPFRRNPGGYGVTGESAGKSRLAHRLVCEKFHGPPPAGKPLALHRCGNGHLGCVNPVHLYWGDFSDNVDDAFAHGTKPVGSMCPQAILHESQIPAIRSDPRTVPEIAREYGVSEGAINGVIYGKSWKHVPWT